MYKILIVGALSQEQNIIKEQIKKLELRNIKTSFLTTGIGNYNMILNLTRFLENNNDFDFVINIGVCGYSSEISLFQREYPQVEGLEKKVQIDQFIQVGRVLNISSGKELIIPHLVDFGKLMSIACSERVIYDSTELEGEEYVDMESYGFEKVCDSFSLPRMLLKVPVDKIGDETKNFDFEKANDLLKNSINYKELIEKIEKNLENTFSVQRKINEADIIDTYKNNFGFTFSENEIFKRFYYRYLAIVNNNFNIYYEENKNLNKKEFLKYLEEYLEKFLVK